MRVERCTCNWRRAVLVQEARVRLERRKVRAVDIERLDFVTVCTTFTGQLLVGERGKGMTYTENTGACSWTLNVRRVSLVAYVVEIGLSIRRSQSLISPFRLPDTSSLSPPRCICTLVIHCRCSRQALTIDVVGFRRWSKTRTAPSPNPATKMLPATWSDVNEVMHEPERAGISCRVVRKSNLIEGYRVHTLVQTSVAAFQTRITFTSPATSALPWPCCQSRTRPAFLLLGISSGKALNAVTISACFDDS